MKYRLLVFLTLSAFLFSCNNNKQSAFSKYLNQDHLAAQSFTIDINRDTMLLTKAGIVIKIPKGSLQSDNRNVKLDVKEALSNEDIVLAGLTTMSGKQALSSGGMLYINPAEGYKATIVKPLEAMVPTKNYDPEMNVYKGTDSAGKIEWKEPQPLPEDSTLRMIKYGKELFIPNCSNCHKVDDDFTGPSFMSLTNKRSKQWIYNFIKSPAEANDRYSIKIKEEWKPTVMTAFPMLTHADIDAILAYVSTAKRKPRMQPDSPRPSADSIRTMNDLCADSCTRYLNALNRAEEQRMELHDADDNEENFFTLDRQYPVAPPAPTPSQPVPPRTNTVSAPPDNETTAVEKETVEPTYTKATFYTINITTFGWMNIDCLLKKLSECTPSELFVNLNADKNLNYTVLLIVPSVKAFVNGGKLADGVQYGFDEANGKVPLPQGAQCYVIAFAEVDGKLILGKKELIASEKQAVDIDFAETTKEGLQKAIRDLKLDGVDADVKDSKKAEEIRAIDKLSEEVEKLRPKNCNCIPLAQAAPSISTSGDMAMSNALGNGDFLSEENMFP